jgi:hypothetical protein
VADISFLCFRTHTNLAIQDEVPVERNDGDDNDDDDDDDDDDDTASASHTPSPSLSAASNAPKKKRYDTSDLCATLTKFIASRDKPDSESMTKKKQLTICFEDIAQTMVKFP